MDLEESEKIEILTMDITEDLARSSHLRLR